MTVAQTINKHYRERGCLALACKVLDLSSESHALRLTLLEMPYSIFLELY